MTLNQITDEIAEVAQTREFSVYWWQSSSMTGPERGK